MMIGSEMVLAKLDTVENTRFVPTVSSGSAPIPYTDAFLSAFTRLHCCDVVHVNISLCNRDTPLLHVFSNLLKSHEDNPTPQTV
jgi:hypothetical protein